MAACTEDNDLRELVVDEISDHEPAVTYTDLKRSIDADDTDIMKVIENLLHDGDLDADMLLWHR